MIHKNVIKSIFQQNLYFPEIKFNYFEFALLININIHNDIIKSVDDMMLLVG